MQVDYRGVEGDRFPFGDRFIFDGSGGERIVVTVQVEGGRIKFKSFAIVAPAVTSDLLRAVPMRDLHAEIHRRLTGTGPGTASLLDGRAFLAELYRGSGRDVPEYLAQAEKAVHAAVENLRAESGGRRPLTDERLRDVAIAYQNAYAIDPRAPLVILTAEFGYSHNTVAGWVRRARAAGWLAPTTPGRAEGEPGPRLIEYLERLEEE